MNKKDFSLSWFFRWFLDNKAITVFLVTLLLGLNILLLSKLTFLFNPLLEFLRVILLPIIISGLLYYLLNPIVDWLEKKGLSRVLAISLVFILIVLALIWGLAVAIPHLQQQTLTFIKNLPDQLRQLDRQLDGLLADPRFDQIKPEIESYSEDILSQVTTWASGASSKLVNGLSTFFSAASQIIVAIIMMPFIVFYLLRDGKNLKSYITKFLPDHMRKPVGQVLTDVNAQLANYVRGQVTVAIIVAIMFIIFFKIIGLKYAVTLGVTAGVLNMVPYLGSFLAMIPALVLGLIAGPFMLAKVILVFVIEQTIEGRFVSPLVLGSQLAIHPITILFVLLTSGSMFGIWGVLLGIPVYASAKVVLAAIFEWYKKVSGLYTEEYPLEEGKENEL